MNVIAIKLWYKTRDLQKQSHSVELSAEVRRSHLLATEALFSDKMSTDNGVLLLLTVICFPGVSGKTLHGDELSIKRFWKSRSTPANWREDPRYGTSWTPGIKF